MDLALFDFDHTITTRDTFTDFLHCALSRRRIAFGRALLTPAIVGHRCGVVSSNAIRAQVVRVAFTGDDHARVQETGADGGDVAGHASHWDGGVRVGGGPVTE